MKLKPHFTVSADDLSCRRMKGDVWVECPISEIQQWIDDGWRVSIVQVRPEYHNFGGVRSQRQDIIVMTDNTVIQV